MPPTWRRTCTSSQMASRFRAKCCAFQPPGSTDSSVNAAATYEFSYALPAGHRAEHIMLNDDVLSDGNFAPGEGWEATYVEPLFAFL